MSCQGEEKELQEGGRKMEERKRRLKKKDIRRGENEKELGRNAQNGVIETAEECRHEGMHLIEMRCHEYSWKPFKAGGGLLC